MAGKGKHPFRSSWAFKIAARDDTTNLIHQQIKWGDNDITEKTIFNDWFFDAAPSGSTGRAKIWNGSAFVAKPAKVWNGSSWVTKPLKSWNGSAWVTTNY